MAQPPLLNRRARRARLTLAICAAFHKSLGPALPRNSANLAPRHLRLPWLTTSRTRYNSIALAALAIHQRHLIRNFNTHFPPSPLPVPLIYPPHHLHRYQRALLQELHRHLSLCRCFMSAHILLRRSFPQSYPVLRLVRLVLPARLPMPPKEVMIHVS
jgi:hypothetical protein